MSEIPIVRLSRVLTKTGGYWSNEKQNTGVRSQKKRDTEAASRPYPFWILTPDSCILLFRSSFIVPHSSFILMVFDQSEYNVRCEWGERGARV
ncbi:MAG: hypothetical protein M3362_11250, partial [Acidobacteriota bacterium]|nr:hypothetical protein [Acidobacteriota bacterium]